MFYSLSLLYSAIGSITVQIIRHIHSNRRNRQANKSIPTTDLRCDITNGE